ncbi:MAG: hypothetical protein D6820_04930, partial [Lentisphaerae bacterium]
IHNMLRGKWKNRGKKIHIIGSDRWNGISIGKTWGWGEFIAFDQYLRRKLGRGLQGRTRREIVKEISSRYGDHWQRWQLERYADHLIASQEKFREHGLSMTFETHGSFPFAGGELGRKLARTHIGVGTDLFWELRRQDLYWSLGTRFAVVAVNPDLRSGAYNQWGWVNSELNRYWFANSGSVEPARRQWYSTYYAGRIDLRGEFQPYHVFGFSSQGGHSTQFTRTDIRYYTRTVNLMTQLRPEQVTGHGIVVSWALQERRMGPRLGRQGFGLYPEDRWQPVDTTMGHVYHRLVKQGVPISFVTSTHALKSWQGGKPLIIVDGFNLDAWEFDHLERLNARRTPVFAIGAPDDSDHSRALQFFGLRQTQSGLEPALPQTIAVVPGDGVTVFIRRSKAHAPRLYCPCPPEEIPGTILPQFAKLWLEQTGHAIQVPPGIVPYPFIAQNRLFITFNDQGDFSRRIRVRIRPAILKPGLDPAGIRVIDVDRATVIPCRREADSIVFAFPIGASDGRMFLIDAKHAKE